jgi:uroporphyrinogen-III synthase
MRRLLVLRPQPGARATAERARELGLDCVAIPLFKIEPVRWEVPEPSAFDGLLLTSANAVWSAGEQVHKLRGLRTFAVGEATAEAARDAGFDIAASGDAGIERLLASIDPDLRLLHLCGEDRKDLGEARQAITPIPVYRSKPIETRGLSEARSCVALVHSPRAGRRLAELVKERSAIAVAAISAAAAEAVGEGWQRVEAAEKPTDEALLALAALLCNNSPPK